MYMHIQVWACLRTLDSFGIQHAHVVSDPSTYSKKARLNTMCTAMGSQKWLTLHGHDSPEDAVAKLKADGYQVSKELSVQSALLHVPRIIRMLMFPSAMIRPRLRRISVGQFLCSCTYMLQKTRCAMYQGARSGRN